MFLSVSLGGAQAHTLGTIISFYPREQNIKKSINNKNINNKNIDLNKNDNNISQLNADDENMNGNNFKTLTTSPNQFNKGLKRKHSLKTKYKQEKKSTYTKIAQTKQTNKQSQIIKAQFNPKHLLLVVGIYGNKQCH